MEESLERFAIARLQSEPVPPQLEHVYYKLMAALQISRASMHRHQAT